MLSIYNTIDSNYDNFIVDQLKGRYITNGHILPLLKTLPTGFTHQELGKSEQGKPIYEMSYGSGPIKILAWSQMHGNESTCTKAIFDAVFSMIPLGLAYLSDCISLKVIPILNPDGAQCYTRLNSNGVDLNRDAKDLSQTESQFLQRVFNSFMPDYCFNRHDQRTIFSAGNQPHPATVSFLSPSENEQRSFTLTRRKAMAVINHMNSVLQAFIPNQVGRYTDEFNINCVGDMLQSKGTPTILFEAGHFQADYQRDITRKFILMAFLEALISISNGPSIQNIDAKYLNIPENKPHYFDLLFKNTAVDGLQNSFQDIGVTFEEVFNGSGISFVPKIKQLGDLKHNFGHQTLDVNGQSLTLNPDGSFLIGTELFKISL